MNAGLWIAGTDDDGEQGWWFHDWLDIHQTAAKTDPPTEGDAS